ncbi:unnamed protein product [Trichogramma brassicae]|uniref:DUF7041 domain-containing protein n=1 Tax=Trichogramma brassicae TaxID=86971 RepID=A0A6H5J428_9HYME|nr:unnamed protein product [Trichogramma brassicae]
MKPSKIDDRFMRLLLGVSEGYEVNRQDKSGSAPLHWAVIYDNKEMVRWLFKEGANPNLANVNGENSLHTICRYTKNHDLAETLFELSDQEHHPVRGASLETLNHDRATPLHVVCNRANADASFVQILIEPSSRLKWPLELVNSWDKSAKAPLHSALEHGNKEVVEELLTRDADPNRLISSGLTPLQLDECTTKFTTVNWRRPCWRKAGTCRSTGRTSWARRRCTGLCATRFGLQPPSRYCTNLGCPAFPRPSRSTRSTDVCVSTRRTDPVPSAEKILSIVFRTDAKNNSHNASVGCTTLFHDPRKRSSPYIEARKFAGIGRGLNTPNDEQQRQSARLQGIPGQSFQKSAEELASATKKKNADNPANDKDVSPYESPHDSADSSTSDGEFEKTITEKEVIEGDKRTVETSASLENKNIVELTSSLENKDDALDTHTMTTTKFELPRFWRTAPKAWFTQAECLMSANSITADDSKFNYVVGALDQTTAVELMDVIDPPPADEIKYKTLKDAILNRTTDSTEKQLHQLLTSLSLGSDKPSALWRRMKSLAGDKLKEDALKVKWLDLLPQSASMFLSILKTASMDELTEAADKLVETGGSVMAVSRTSQQEPADSHMIAQRLAALEAQMAQVVAQLSYSNRRNSQQRGRSSGRRRDGSQHRGRSRSPDTPKICWYHRKHGKDAERCTLPCPQAQSSSPVKSNLPVKHSIVTSARQLPSVRADSQANASPQPKKLFDDLLKKGIIRPSNSQWASPLHWCPKAIQPGV